MVSKKYFKKLQNFQNIQFQNVFLFFFLKLKFFNCNYDLQSELH